MTRLAVLSLKYVHGWWWTRASTNPILYRMLQDRYKPQVTKIPTLMTTQYRYRYHHWIISLINKWNSDFWIPYRLHKLHSQSQLPSLSTPLIVTNLAGPLNVILSGFDCSHCTHLGHPKVKPIIRQNWDFYFISFYLSTRKYLSNGIFVISESFAKFEKNWNLKNDKQIICQNLTRVKQIICNIAISAEGKTNNKPAFTK